jgi:enoyl-CoA hydratase/carnithine racemase
MSDAILLRQDHGAITTLTLNAPASLNALSTAMLLALETELDAIAPSATRVLILNATGRTFCAGHDLREIQGCRSDPDGGRAAFTALFALCARVMVKLANLPQPTIASVQGTATAAGCQLATSCDFIVAADTARFGVNGVNIGLFCTTPLVALSRKILPTQAYDLAATGDFLSATRALTLGLANRIATPDDLATETLRLAETLASKLPTALAIGKAARTDHNLPQAYETASAAMVANLMKPETDEGLTAFLAKRPPNWA